MHARSHTHTPTKQMAVDTSGTAGASCTSVQSQVWQDAESASVVLTSVIIPPCLLFLPRITSHEPTHDLPITTMLFASHK